MALPRDIITMYHRARFLEYEYDTCAYDMNSRWSGYDNCAVLYDTWRFFYSCLAAQEGRRKEGGNVKEGIRLPKVCFVS